jgi:hypothetical protein
MSQREFDLLERLCARLDGLAGDGASDDIRAGFARGTGGCDVDYLAELISARLAAKPSGFHPDADAGTAASAKVAGELFEERVRQQIGEPYTADRDDEYLHGQLENAALTYLQYGRDDGRFKVAQAYQAEGEAPASWPWEAQFWKPSSRRRMLVKAGALVIAAIERLDREAGK